MGTEQKNSGRPDKITGHTVRDRRPYARHEMGGREGVVPFTATGSSSRPSTWRYFARCPAWARLCSFRFRIPGSRAAACSAAASRSSPTRGTRPGSRSIGCRSSGRFRLSTPRSPRRACTRRSLPRSISPATCASITATSMRRSRAAKIVEATLHAVSRPSAHGAGNATVLVTSDRVDIWIGDQSPQETHSARRRSAGLPEENVHLHMCHLGGVRPQRQRPPGRARPS